MHITFSHQKLLVYLRRNSHYYESLISLLSSNDYEEKDNLLLINSIHDSHKKEVLLTWLYERYICDVPITLEHFKSMLFSYSDKPIEIRFVKTISDSEAESLEIKVTVWGKNTLIIKPTFYFERVYKYLSLLFEEVIRNDEKGFFELTLFTRAEIEVFERFLTRQKLIAQPIHFSYDTQTLDNFFYLIEEEEAEAQRLQESYMLLDLDPDASFEELKSSYKELAKSCHPDLVATEHKALISQKTTEFQAVQNAYEQIKNSLIAS